MRAALQSALISGLIPCLEHLFSLRGACGFCADMESPVKRHLSLCVKRRYAQQDLVSVRLHLQLNRKVS